MRKVLLIRELGRSDDEDYASERSFHAFETVRAQLAELEERCSHDELFRDAVTVTLEAHRDQLAVLIRAQNRAQRRQNKGLEERAT